jgi:hypothetical protein
LSELRAWIAARNDEVVQDGELHLGPENSPLSIYSRVKGARTALMGECEKLSRLRGASLQGSVELYWLSKWMDARLEHLWAAMDLEELRRREEVCDHVARRFAALIPPSVFASFGKAVESPGAVAVAVAEAQGHNAELVTQLRTCEEEFLAASEVLVRAEVGEANIEAAGTLAEFEWAVLAAPPPFPSLPRAEQDARGGRGFTALEQARAVHAQLVARGDELEAQLARVKDDVARSIDVLERTGSSPEALRALAACKDALSGALSV